jgi:hypothetical protein
LALELRDAFSLHAFVETGLGQGTSALWAEKHFDMVVSVEIDRGLVYKFRYNYPSGQVIIACGDSAELLVDVVKTMTVPALFWLDGHTDDYTPVLAELAAINSSTLPHAIMIDDWRLFGACPAWPSKEKVIELATNKTRLVYDVDDVLVCKPI